MGTENNLATLGAKTAGKAACRSIARIVAVGLLSTLLFAQDADYTFHTQTEIVLVNVTVRDRSGNLVRDLKPEDFSVKEDGKAQKLLSFDIENTEVMPALDVAQTPVLALPKGAVAPPAAVAATAFKDRRLIVLFFDLSSMQPDEIDRSATAAENYVDKQMAPADLVAVLSLSSSLTVNQDFTSDKSQLTKVLQGFNAGAGQGFEAGTTGTTEGTPDTGGSFTADDTEFNIYNTDRRLEALRSIAQKLSGIDQKKSLIYFSSGMDRTGIENQSELRSAINAAVRANLSIYTMDIRGLQALAAGGDAQTASLRGTSPYSGQSTLNAYNENFSSQETLVTLAGDTGGRAFLDSNDFSKVFTGVQQDTAGYYVLGYDSSNPARDGRYRKITVSLKPSGFKVDYRHGYFAPADYQHSARDDRERQLKEQLASDLAANDLPVYLGTGYFRVASNKFFVPISLVVPGSEIPFTRSSDLDKATLDVIGIVEDAAKRPAGNIRDTVKLSVNTSTQVKQKNVQYDSGLELPSGSYHLKFVVRENQTGRMGTFETGLTIPDLKKQSLQISSIVLSNQIQPAGKRRTAANNPLFRDGAEIIPNVAHVFSGSQHLYLYFEVYDPGRTADSKPDPKSGGNGPIRVLTNVAFYRGTVKAYETAVLEGTELNSRDHQGAVFQLDVPLNQLKPGFYSCQVNVIDDAAGRFLFPRVPLLIR